MNKPAKWGGIAPAVEQFRFKRKGPQYVNFPGRQQQFAPLRRDCRAGPFNVTSTRLTEHARDSFGGSLISPRSFANLRGGIRFALVLRRNSTSGGIFRRDFMKAEKKIVPFPGGARQRDRDELAFLPAALEIVETPPSPIGRAIGATVIALFVLALGWASLGHVDIVATATGKIIPTGHSKVIQPFETGVVHAILVANGQNVNAGDVLIELDPTINDSATNHLSSD